MNTVNSQVVPVPPSVTRSLLAGFDTIANHLGLILFSIGLDALLWFGPQLRLTRLFASYLDWSLAQAGAQTPQMTEFVTANREALLETVARFNLLGMLRSLPLGIPSLMAGRMPAGNPLSMLGGIELQSFGGVLLISLGLIAFGLAVGALYFHLVSQAAIGGKVAWGRTLHDWPKAAGQVFLLALFLLAVLAAVSLPLSCVLPFLMISGGSLGKLLLFMYAGMMIWLLFPVIYSPFGIFLHQDKMWASLLRGIRLARMTLPYSVLFALAGLVLSQGLDMLWAIPKDTSWLAVVGVIGHAFISSGIIAAAFVFYRDAEQFLQQKQQKIPA